MGMKKNGDTGSESNQPYLHCQFKLKNDTKGKKFDVLTGHFKSGSSSKDQKMKKAHAKWIAERLNEVHAAGRAVILACDFNMGCDDKAFTHFNETRNEEIVSAYERAMIPVDAKKFPTTIKWRMGGTQWEKIADEIDIQRIIDYIFYNKDLKESAEEGCWLECVDTLSTPDAETIRKATNDRGLPSMQYPSDHLMIGARFKLHGMAPPVGAN